VKRALLMLLFVVAVVTLLAGCPNNKDTDDVIVDAQPKMTDVAGAEAEASGEVTIYVPCGLTIPARESIAAFEAANPGITVEGTYDNAITNALNIKEKDERPDLFVSPGKREVEILEEAGIVDPADKWKIGYFELAVVAPKDNPRDIHSIEDLTKADVLSMPDPDRNSIGDYGRQALEGAGLWDELMPEGDERIILTEFPISAYEMVVSGKSEGALMFENCPLQTEPDKLEEGSVEVVQMVDKDLYERPFCFVALLKDAPNPVAARKFADFLVSADGQAVLAENHLKTLGEEAGMVGGEATDEGTETAADPDAIRVEAYYPGNEDHKYVQELMADVNKKYAPAVHAEFIDFTSDEGYERRKAAGLSCGTILINGEYNVTIETDGESRDVMFQMGKGAYWNPEDLFAYLDQLTAE